MTDTTHAPRPTSEPGVAGMTLEHLRLYGVGWCTEATFALMCDVIDAAERRRQAQIVLDATPDHSAEEQQAWHVVLDAEEDQDAALANLAAHLRPDAPHDAEGEGL